MVVVEAVTEAVIWIVFGTELQSKALIVSYSLVLAELLVVLGVQSVATGFCYLMALQGETAFHRDQRGPFGIFC